jgi:hypothetical protein
MNFLKPYKSEFSALKVKCEASVYLVACALFISVSGCITPFEPKIEKYDNLLVVDGLLTNLPNKCRVTLSRTYPYNQKRNKLEKNAIVKIIDDQENAVILRDNEDGIYLPENKDFAGTIGRKYKVYIKTTGGEVCESDPAELKEPVDVGNLYYKLENVDNGTHHVQFYVDTYDPAGRSVYYSWDYEETWEFWVPYVSMSEYMPETKICYSDNSSRKILIESTKDYTDDKVIGFPLFYVTNTTNRLSVKYSVLVTQYVLNEETYTFYKNLKNINENTGTLFDPTPVILTGNIRNISTPEQPVLGNFQVSGASVNRIFVNRYDLPDDWMIPTEYEFCKADLLKTKSERPKIDSLMRLGWTVMDTLYDPIEKDTLLGLVISRACFDCRTKGEIKKPDFWDED